MKAASQLGWAALFWCMGMSAFCAEQPDLGTKSDDSGMRPGVVRLVRGPASATLDLAENAASALSKALLGFADWASINNRLTDQTERLLYGRLPREELEINAKDPLAEVAIKTVLQNLPLKLECTATSTNLLFQRKRRAMRVGNGLMERDSAEYRRWLDTQIKGLEETTQEIEVDEFVQARSLVLWMSSEMESDESSDPANPSQTALFTVTASLTPARRWSGEKWSGWGSVSLENFKVAIKLPRDWKRESLIRQSPFTTKVINGFGVVTVDRIIWPPPALREQFPLLGLLSDQVSDAYFAALQRIAQSGDAEGQYLLGLAYDRGEGTVVDSTKAAQWWEQSAKGGYPPGICAAGEACLRGIGRTSDPKQGIKYLEKAASQGSARAMTLLGAQELNNPKQTGTTGLARIQKAAEAGDPSGLLLMASAHFTGNGVAKDFDRGMQFERAAAIRGHPAAMLGLGRFYAAQGKGKEAWTWYYLAAKYNTTLIGKDYEEAKRQAVSEILKLRQELSETELETAHQEGAAMEAIYRPLWTRQ